MAEQPKNAEGANRKSTGADLIIPVAAIAFTIYYFTTIWHAPWTAQVNTLFVGSVLIALCAVFFLLFFLQWRSGGADLSLGRILDPVNLIPKRVALLALTISYVIVIKFVGFIITTYVFLAAAMLLLAEGKNAKSIVVLSVLLAVFSYSLPLIMPEEWVGYIVLAIVVVAGLWLFWAESPRKGLILSLSGSLAIGGYLLFVVAFQRRFPDGPIEKWLKPFWYSTLWQ